MQGLRRDDDDDLDGIQDDHDHNEADEKTTDNLMEDEVDPLDAYMAQIDAEVKETMRKDSVRKLPVLKPLEDPILDEPSEPEEDKSDPKLETAEEIMALAQKVAKRKDLGQVDHSLENYDPFRKNFYIESPAISSMSDEEVAALRETLDGIRIRGKNCPRPVQKWTQCGLDQRIMEVIRRAGYEKPTPIQAQTIPAIMSGRDIIGIAKTGSGKTVAFLLPMFRHILDQRKLGPTEGPICLIMTPTRELAMQIYVECHRFSRPLGLSAVCACGGAPIKEQIADLKRGAEILVCTPGRLLELLMANSGRVTNLKRVTYLVLDEADRMFDMGFGPQVLKIVANIRPDKQAVLFSATFPRQMEALARKVLVRPLEIVVGDRSVVCDDVTQRVEVLQEEEKFVRLLEILGEWYPEHAKKILIFVDKQDAADNLLKDLLRRGYPCLSIHGGKDQADRDSAIEDFKSGVAPVLVATSVAARGLDVKDLSLVINYECPNHMEDYVHRVGRTGRAGNKGTAFTFITPNQQQHAGDIVRALVASNVQVPPTLTRLVTDFENRVKEGSAQASSSGFGGKGLERIDQEHERARKVQKKSALGDEASSSEDELEDVFEKAISPAVPQVIKPAPVPAEKRTVLPNEALAAIQSLNAKIVQEGRATSKPDALTELNKRYEGVGISSDGPQLGEIIPVYDAIKPGTATPDPTVPRQPKSFFCELDINDFPQIVRWRTTHKDNVGHLQEYSGASVVIRGEYFPPGRVVEKGQRRLHVRIDADMYAAVDKARAEVRRLLHQFTVEAAAKGSIDFSRYEL